MPEKKRILIIDDDPDIHRLLMKALRAPDRLLESAFDGSSGLQRIINEEWALVLSDVVMPNMDGMTMLENAHRMRPGTRIVMMTVANTAENIVNAIRENALAWLSKPFSIESIREVVDRALKSEKPGDDIEVISATPRWLGLRLRCKMETAARLLQFVREMERELPEEEQEGVAVAFREILLNAIEHGGGNDPDKFVTITCVRAAGALLYYVADPGLGFSFDKLAHAAVSNPTNSPLEHTERRHELGMRSGGFGILITRSLIDELIYNERGNEVLLIKYLRPAANGAEIR